jgi:hypothetical protein
MQPEAILKPITSLKFPPTQYKEQEFPSQGAKQKQATTKESLYNPKAQTKLVY